MGEHPDWSERARKWIEFFEQLPEDDPLLVEWSGYYDANDLRDGSLRYDSQAWNVFCTALQTDIHVFVRD